MGFKRNGVDVPAAVGLAYARMLGIEGVDAASAVPRVFPVQQAAMTSRFNLPAGETVLTLAIMRTGILTSFNPGSTVITLPTLAALGFTRPTDGSAELYFKYQRCGDGPLFINPASAAVRIVWNDMDPQFLPQYHPVAALLYCGTDGAGKEVWAAT